MPVRISRGPRLEVNYRNNVPEKYSYQAIYEHMTKNNVIEELDKEIRELRRKEARSWARARERGARF